MQQRHFFTGEGARWWEKLYVRLQTSLWMQITTGSVLIALVALLYFTVGSRRGSEETSEDFHTLSQIAQELYSRQPLTEENSALLQSLLERHPHVHPSFDAPLALVLLAQGDHEKGALFAKLASSRRAHIELHPDLLLFADISQAIESGLFTEAIQLAHTLDDHLCESGAFATLRTYNLLRLALLEKNAAHFVAASREENFAEVASLFQEGSLSLKDLFTP